MSSPALLDVFEHEMASVPIWRAMTARGLRIDDKLRKERIKLLRGRQDELLAAVQGVVYEEWDGLKRPDLFLLEKRCGCCGGGTLQRAHCWACNTKDRFESHLGTEAPTVAIAKELEYKSLKALKEDLNQCDACGGAGKLFDVEFNPDSAPQCVDLLYDAMGLPARTDSKKKSEDKRIADEEALQSLVALDPSGLVLNILRYRKLATMREIYERLEPDPSGHVHSVFNPMGTYTNRPSSAGAFYVPNSTNLLNLTESEAARDPLYAVRDVIVPEPGEVLMYADLAAAEARVVAALSEDKFLLERWERDPSWSPHKWTAAKIFGVAEETLDKKSPLYFLGKQARHAFNYGEGPNKFWRVINSSADVTGVAITLQQARETFAGYHKLHPNLDGIWWDRVEKKIRREGFLVNCYGFRCNFFPRFDPESGALDAETLRAAIAWEPQSTIGMLAKRALAAAWKEERGGGFRVLLETYDGIVVGVDRYRINATARTLKRVLEQPLGINGFSLLIPAEVFVCSARWSEAERVL